MSDDRVAGGSSSADRRSGSVGIGFAVPASVVRPVAGDGPAAEAGLRPRDVITAVRGVATLHPDSIAHLEATSDAGDDVHVTYLRDGGEHQATVVLRASSTK